MNTFKKNFSTTSVIKFNEEYEESQHEPQDGNNSSFNQESQHDSQDGNNYLDRSSSSNLQNNPNSNELTISSHIRQTSSTPDSVNPPLINTGDSSYDVPNKHTHYKNEYKDQQEESRKSNKLMVDCLKRKLSGNIPLSTFNWLDSYTSDDFNSELRQKVFDNPKLSSDFEKNKSLFDKDSQSEGSFWNNIRNRESELNRYKGPDDEFNSLKKNALQRKEQVETLRGINKILNRKEGNKVLHKYTDDKNLAELENKYMDSKKDNSISESLNTESSGESSTIGEKRAYDGIDSFGTSNKKPRVDLNQEFSNINPEIHSTNNNSPNIRSDSEDSDMYGGPASTTTTRNDRDDDNNSRGGSGIGGFPPLGPSGPSGTGGNSSSSGPNTSNKVEHNQTIFQILANIDWNLLILDLITYICKAMSGDDDFTDS